MANISVTATGITIQNGDLVDNDDWGGFRNEGGGTLTLRNVIVQDSTRVFDGGGINNVGGTVRLTNVLVRRNSGADLGRG